MACLPVYKGRRYNSIQQLLEENNLTEKAKTVLTDLRNRNNIRTPLIALGHVNNPILSRIVNFDVLEQIGGIKGELMGKTFNELNEFDRYNRFRMSFEEGLTRRGKKKYFSMVDPTGDRSTAFAISWFFGGDNAYSTKTMKKGGEKRISDISRDDVVQTMHAINQIADYYYAAHLKAKKEYEDAMNSGFENPYDAIFNLKVNEHYRIVNNQVVPSDLVKGTGHPIFEYHNRRVGKPENYNSVMRDRDKKYMTIVDESAKDYEIFKEVFSDEYDKMIEYFNSIGVIEDHVISMSEGFNVSALSQETRDKLKNDLGAVGIDISDKTMDEIKKATYDKSREIQTQIDEIKKQRDASKSETNKIALNKQMSDLILQKNKIKALRPAIGKAFKDVVIANNMRDGSNWNMYYEAMFISNFIGSESMNHVTRGNSFMYKDFTDWIKRGQGLTAPRQKFSTSGKQIFSQPLKYVTLQDIDGFNTLFNGNKTVRNLMSDSASFINPIAHRMLYNASGGQFGQLGMGSMKNVVYGYDYKKHDLVYHKFNQFGSTIKTLENDPLMQVVNKSLMGEAFYDEFLAKAKELKSVAKAADYFINIYEYGIDSTNETDQDTITENEATVERVRTSIDNMVHYAVFQTGVKANARRINRWERDKRGMYVLKPFELVNQDGLNRDLISETSWDDLGFQTITKQDIDESDTALPTQTIPIVSSGEANTQSARMINEAQQKLIEEGAKSVRIASRDRAKSRVFITNLMRRYYDNRNEGTKVAEIARLGLDPHLAHKRAIEIMGSAVHKSVTPRMSGTFHIQSASGFELYVSNDGFSQLTKQDFDNLPEIEKANYTKRKLKPIDYLIKQSDGNYVPAKSIEELEKANPQDVKFVSAEVVAPFIYAANFGITNDMTLSQVMTLSGKESLNTYQTNISIAMSSRYDKDGNYISGERSYRDTMTMIALYMMNEFSRSVSKQRKSNKFAQDILNKGALQEDFFINDVYLKQSDGKYRKAESLEEIQNADPKDIYEMDSVRKFKQVNYIELFKQAYNDESYANDMLKKVNPELRSFIKSYIVKNRTGKLEVPKEEADKILTTPVDVLQGLTAYYYNLNRALDIYSVRIPTTNSNMGFMGRIVEFDLEGENTLHVSPEKNILDGSDYDADQLNVIYRSINDLGDVSNMYKVTVKGEEQTIADEAALKNQIFDAINLYYENPANYMQILQQISLESMRKRVAKKEKEQNVSSNIARSLEVYDHNAAGTFLPGHFANLGKFSYVIMGNPELKSIFKNAKTLTEAAEDPKKLFELTSLLTALVNAATDNANEGGMLGKLNVNTATTNLISGIIFSGFDKEMLRKEIERVNPDKLNEPDFKLDTLEDFIFEILDLPLVKEAAKKSLASLKLSFSNISAQTALHNYKLSDNPEMNSALINMHANGMAISKMRFIYGIQSKLPTQREDIYRAIYELETAFGMSIEDVLNGVESNVDNQIKWTNANHPGYYKKNYDTAIDKKVREAYNFSSFVQSNPSLFATLKTYKHYVDVIKNVFVFDNSELLDHLMTKGQIKDRHNKDKAMAIVNGIETRMIGMYLDEQVVNMKVLGKDIVLDLSIGDERAMFIEYFPKYHTEVIKKREQYQGNKWLSKINTTGTGPYNQTVIEFSGGRSYGPEATNFYIEEFTKLEEADKKLYRIYQLAVHGLAFKTGSYVNFMDMQNEIGYDRWYRKSLDVNGVFEFKNNDLHVDEIMARESSLSSFNYKGSGEKRKIKPDVNYTHLNKNGLFISVGKVEDGNVTPLIVPYRNWYNSNSENKTTSQYPNAPGTNFDNMKKLLKEGSYNYKSYNDITLQKSSVLEGENRYPHIPIDGGTAVDAYGLPVKIEKISDKEVKVTRVKATSNIDLSDTQASVNTIRGKRIKGIGIETIYDLIKGVFPNISVVITNSTDPSNMYPDYVSYVKKGVVYLNSDKIKYDTLVHELGHIVLPILKEVSPSSYNALKSQALNLLNDNSLDAQMISSLYKDRSQEDIVEEVIANMIGWNSADKIEAFLNNSSSVPYDKSKVNEIFNSIIGAVRNAYSALKQFFREMFGVVDINIDATTIEELSNQITDAVINKKVISNITSSQVQDLRNMTNNSLFASKEINTFGELQDVIKSGFGNNKEYLAHQVEVLRNEIENNDGKTPYYYTGTETKIDFDIYDTRNYNKLVDIVKQMGSYDLKISEDIAKWLNRNAPMSDDAIKEILGTFDAGGEQVSKYKMIALSKLKQSLEFMPDKKYYTLQQLQNTEYKHYVNNAFSNLPLLVEVTHLKDESPTFSFYLITGGTLESYNKESNNTLLTKQLVGRNASAYSGLTLTTNELSTKKLLLSMVMSSFIKAGASVYNSQIMQIRRNDIQTRVIDPVEMAINLNALKNTPEFSSLITNESMLEMLDGNQLFNANPDYMSMLISWYNEQDEYKYGIKDLKSKYDDLTDREKIDILKRRLAHLQDSDIKGENNINNYTSYKMREVKYLISAIRSIEELPVHDNKLNMNRAMNAYEAKMIDAHSISDEMLQYAKSTIIKNAHKAVSEYKASAIKYKEVAEFFNDRNSVLGGYAYDTSESIWKEIIVMEKDVDGNEFWNGHIYWTKDETLDPLYGKKAKELGISQELLDKGKVLVDIITDQLAKTVQHKMQMNDNTYWSYDTNAPFSYNEALEVLKKSGYRKGAMPLMTMTTSGAIGIGKVKSAASNLWNSVTNVYEFFETVDENVINEGKKVNQLSDAFYHQFGLHSSAASNNKYGNVSRQENILGVRLKYDEEKGSFWSVENLQANKNLTTDFERVMNYFTMSMIKVRNYESQVLPIVNGIDSILAYDQKFKNVNNKEKLNWLKDYAEQAIENKRKGQAMIYGVNVKKGVDALTSAAYMATMPLNANVAIVSLFANTAYAWVEGISNSLAQAAGVENVPFNANDLRKATANVTSNLAKAWQIMMQFQLLNDNDYEQINMPIFQKTKNQMLSKWHTSVMNWSVDAFSKMIITYAILEHEGIYDAIDYKDGKLSYDQKRDKRFEYNNDSYSDKGEAFIKVIKREQTIDGIRLDGDDGDLKNPLTLKEINRIRFFSEKYVTGAYSNKSKAVIGNYVLGQIFTMYFNWFMTRLENAFGQEKTLHDSGKIIMVKDMNGNWVGEYQVMKMEGYIRTMVKTIFQLFRTGNINWESMPDHKKYNLIKNAVNMGMFIFMGALYQALVKTEGDDDDEKNLTQRILNIEGVIKDYRLVKNWSYASKSLLMLPVIMDKLSHPFAAIDIIKNMIVDKYSRGLKINTTNYPFKSQINTMLEFNEMLSEEVEE